MPKKTKALAVREVEVLRPAPQIPDARAAIEQLVEQKIAEIMGNTDAIFEPFFRTKAVAIAIKKLQTVAEQRKWSDYFAAYGCLVCRTKKQPHRSIGMCQACHQRILVRLAGILRRAAAAAAERPGAPAVRDLTDLARRRRS